MLGSQNSGRALIPGLIALAAFKSSAYAGISPMSIRERDAKITCGSIQFTRIDHVGSHDVSTKEELNFSADGRFRHSIQDPVRYGNDVKAVVFVKGSDWRYWERTDAKGTTILFDDMTWPYDSDHRFFLVSRSCMPLAGGLNIASLEQGASPSLLVGVLTDRTAISIDSGSRNDGIPASIERSWNGRVVNRWDYTGSVPAGGDLRLPARADFTDSVGKNNNRSFVIEKAVIGTEPSEEALVNWSYQELKTALKGVKNPTPDDLLVLSQQRAQYFKVGDADKRARAAQISGQSSAGGRNFLIAFVVAAFALIGGVFAFRKSKKS
jgi:hypothetical protein